MGDLWIKFDCTTFNCSSKVNYVLGNDLCLVSGGIKYDRNKNNLMYCVTKQPIGSLPEGYTNGTIIFRAFGSECNLMGFQVVKLRYLESKPRFLFTPKSSADSKLASCQIL
jgi:hypothetical protein